MDRFERLTMVTFSQSLVGACSLVALLACACGGSAEDSAGDPFGTDKVDPILLGPDSELGHGEMTGSGSTDERYMNVDVTRNGRNYRLMTNGWGPGWESHTISWNGTAFVVESLLGSEGADYEPAAYPTEFCGQYSTDRSGECGLPADIASLASVKTGWWWDPHDNAGEFNAAYDVWLSDGSGSLTGYFMVWYRLPPGQYPAGDRKEVVSVGDIPGKWSIYEGFVWDSRPIINYVRNQGSDTHALEFDLMDFIHDAEDRGYVLPGNQILSVAVGFEIWNGPIANLETKDFYVEVESK